MNREHQDIMEAALARDAERAGALMMQHLKLTTCVLLEQGWLADKRPTAAGSSVQAAIGAAATAA